MGVHKREREMEDLKENYIKKSSCYLLVVLALLAGCFIGNTITMLYMANTPSQGVRQVQTTSSQPAAPAVDSGRLAELEGIAKANPTDANAWAQLGHYCFDNDLPTKAVAAYERSLELRPNNVGVWSDLGVMYRRTKQFDKAVDAFRHAASLDPKHVVSRFNMGIVYLHDLNDRANALKVWKEVLSIDPQAKTPGGRPVAELVREMEGK
ncbi:tetratricopeptide repeat protein [Pseudodesulfovibrio cashew]|uniref:Tetratricopeptide repeat protein n=1 Tax=Pseudodesulfovibrio cashew TaxID=2678688 RepID=A0A6I6JU51_9BACT|nr:tetratricopeptide repeat protein [Pseudodesulfovibrio cashew]QGY41224.1 tetratricopeptide repeat protein [Pseudodesulfovibrio cashew]